MVADNDRRMLTSVLPPPKAGATKGVDIIHRSIGRVAPVSEPGQVRLAARRECSVDRPLPAGRPDVVLLELRGDVLGFDG